MIESLDSRHRRVVVIGGGYAGIKAAHVLDSVADVTLIDRKNAFFHRVASLRSAVDPAWTHRAFVPYDRLLGNGRFVQATVTGIDPAERLVHLDHGESFPFDAAIIATGSEAAAPAQFIGQDSLTAAAAMRDHQAQIRDAQSIVIVGGGAVGVELAGEIRAAHPAKPITLTESSSRLLNAANNAQLSRQAQALLERKGVVVALGHRFQPDSHSDALVLWAVGSRPETRWIAAEDRSVLNDKGLIQVDSYLRVKGWDSVFAIGDATDAHPKKLILPAEAQAMVAAHNVREMLDGRRPTRKYSAPANKVLVVPVGSKDGVSLIQGFVLGGTFTRIFKSGDLLTPRYRQSLNYD